VSKTEVSLKINIMHSLIYFHSGNVVYMKKRTRTHIAQK